MRFGIYSDAGPTQCCSRGLGPGANDGSLGHEEVDAQTFASWEVDFVKHDNCASQPSSYPAMRDAINKTGRPMVFSIHGPAPADALANMWRTTPDIKSVAHLNNMSWVLCRSCLG